MAKIKKGDSELERARQRLAEINNTISEGNISFGDAQPLREERRNLISRITYLEGFVAGLTEASMAGAIARSDKYSTMKDAALYWYRQERHNFKNKEDAAIAIQKNHPVEFSTARGWLKGV